MDEYDLHSYPQHKDRLDTDDSRERCLLREH
jgi:hypothetical protein